MTAKTTDRYSVDNNVLKCTKDINYYLVSYIKELDDGSRVNKQATVWELCDELCFGHQLSHIMCSVWLAGLHTFDIPLVVKELCNALSWIDEITKVEKPHHLWRKYCTCLRVKRKKLPTVTIDPALVEYILNSLPEEKRLLARPAAQEFFRLKVLLLNNLIDLAFLYGKTVSDSDFLDTSVLVKSTKTFTLQEDKPKADKYARLPFEEHRDGAKRSLPEDYEEYARDEDYDDD